MCVYRTLNRKDSDGVPGPACTGAHDSLFCCYCTFLPLLTLWLTSLPVATLSPQGDNGAADREKAMVMVGLRIVGLGVSGDGRVESKAATDNNCDSCFVMGSSREEQEHQPTCYTGSQVHWALAGPSHILSLFLSS